MHDTPAQMSVLKERRFSVEKPTIIHGDALQVLRRLDSGCVQCIVTSPPYWGLRDYNVAEQVGLIETLPQYINRLTEVFAEARRVLTDDGVLWLNIGDSFTSGNRGWRAPDRKNPARAMSVRPSTPEGLKSKDLIGLPWRLAFALQEDGWYLRTDIIWNKPNAMPESVRDRPNRSHEFIFMFSKSEKYKYDRDAVRGPNGRNLRSVWDINTKPFPGAHFATFPPELIAPCIKTTTQDGDIVLDPFFGSGTVGLVAEQLGRRYVGIELNPEYVAMATMRLSLTPQMSSEVAA
jgi:site-specific DNA-methyltransferase (cytosine-N4-specific)